MTQSSHSPESSWFSFVRIVLLSLAAGTGAGMVSALWTLQARDQYAAALLADRGYVPQIASQQPQPIPGTYEEALSRVHEQAHTGIATFMPTSSDSVLSKDMLRRSSALGYGAIVSNDGWVAVDAEVFADVKNPENSVEVWVNGTRYAIASLVYDTLTSLVMVRTTAVRVLPLGFAETGGVRSGSLMFAVDGDGAVLPVSVQDSDAEIIVGAQPSERFETQWLLQSAAFAVSAPLLNGSGELAGFTHQGNATVLPLHHALGALRTAMKTNAVPHAALGAYVVNLADAYSLSADVTHSLRAGALVLSPDGVIHATVRGGPAATAGFAQKDIILAVDGEPLTESTSLAEILSLYRPGDTAICTVLRGDETITLSVVLGDTATLVY